MVQPVQQTTEIPQLFVDKVVNAPVLKVVKVINIPVVVQRPFPTVLETIENPSCLWTRC